MIVVLGLAICPCVAYGGIGVNDGGVWKDAQEIHANDAGTWKIAHEVHVNDSGTWRIVFSITGSVNLSFTWEMTDTTNITGYRVYLNSAVLCESSLGTDTTLECNNFQSLPYPTTIHMTSISSVDGESDPSNAFYINQYPAWASNMAYAIGAMVAAPGWSHAVYWEAVTAGTSASSEPPFSAPVSLPYIERKLITNGAAAVDYGNGTVGIPCVGHGFDPANVVTIYGSEHYDGDYTLGAQSDPDVLTITATYSAETFVTAAARLTSDPAQAVVDNGNGTVSMPFPGNPFVAGDTVEISEPDYSGTYTLAAQQPNTLTITTTYVAKELDGGWLFKTGDVVDGTVTWILVRP